MIVFNCFFIVSIFKSNITLLNKFFIIIIIMPE